MHSTVSFDGHDSGLAMAMAAQAAGLKEICFTDHIDHDCDSNGRSMVFDLGEYNLEYNDLEIPGLKIRRGVEYGLKPYNKETMAKDLQQRHFDFVLGSVHFVKEQDIYYKEFWQDKTVEQAVSLFLEETLQCVRHHDDYDVLGHLTYLSKTQAHPTHSLISLDTHKEVVAEIFKVLIAKGKGIEVNTSGIDRCGDYLPAPEYLKLFKDLGGQIVTVGSDAHTAGRVGQYCSDACQIVQDIFGHVCTFENRQPIFHKL
jgi:histidinol-phosphatase (PHP family)